MRVLIGCERSRVVASAFEQRGHEVLSCDLEPARKGGPHYLGDVFDVIDFPWDLAIFHPPCTHTAVSGAKHFAAKREDGRLYAGVSFIMSLVRRSMHIPAVVIEQPVSILSSLWRKPDQIIQPWQFGHGETKATCLWLRGCPPWCRPTSSRDATTEFTACRRPTIVPSCAAKPMPAWPKQWPRSGQAH